MKYNKNFDKIFEDYRSKIGAVDLILTLLVLGKYYFILMKETLYLSGAGEIRREKPNRVGANLNQGEEKALGKQHQRRCANQRRFNDSLICKIYSNNSF